MVQHDARHVEPLPEHGGGDQRLQGLVDHAQGIGGDDQQGKAEVVGQVGDEFGVGHGGHQAACALDQDDVGASEPRLQPRAEQVRIDNTAFRSSSQGWSEGSGEPLGADRVQVTEAARRVPQHQRIVADQVPVAPNAAAGHRLVDPDTQTGTPQAAGNASRHVGLADAGIGARHEESWNGSLSHPVGFTPTTPARQGTAAEFGFGP